MKNCSPFWPPRKRKSKPHKIHLTTVGMATIKNTNRNKYWQAHREKGTLIECWWEHKLVQPLWKTVWKLFNKLKIKWPYAPAGIPLLGKSGYNKDTCTSMFIAALFTINQLWKHN
jgi:hypothetical protein